MSLIMYVYHYCKITGEPCKRGVAAKSARKR